LWPGVVIVTLQWLLRFAVPAIVPDALAIGVFAGLLGGLAVVLWWLFFSRAQWVERLGAIVLMILALVVTSRLIHVSLATGGQGMMFPVYAVPVLSLAFIIWAVASRNLANGWRRVTMVVTILLACGVWTLVRVDGITGAFNLDLAWRWAKTHEEQLLAQTEREWMTYSSDSLAVESFVDWPGFRGANRDGIVRNVKIKTDWSTAPPVEMWRRPIGPGCSSFAVHGNLLYTQEQRGDKEIVSCYHLTSGEPVWQHRDAARFWDSHAGAGPRSTPTICGGRVYTMGATGIVNALDAADGTVIWSRNAATDTGTKDSGWGYTSSPLVVDSLVVVAATGTLAAYDIITGEPRWFGADGGDSYSSPHLMIIDGVAQVLLMSGTGVTSLAPANGTLLWEHPWPRETRIVQPALVDGDVLFSAGAKKGMRRLAVAHGSDGWSLEERWTSSRLRPDFNDFVVHKDHVYGLDGPGVTCIDVEDGARRWKGGRYGGQLLLLADQDLLLVLSEKGELALVEAVPERYTELARFASIEGKTWNHPVLVGDILLVRNTEEMAAFRLPLADV
jgi:outer membrane protein assembly factor BamB